MTRVLPTPTEKEEHDAEYAVKIWRKGPPCECHTNDERLALLIATVLASHRLALEREWVRTLEEA